MSYSKEVYAQAEAILERRRMYSEQELEKRRELLETAGYITGIDNTPSGFEAFVRSCGVQDFTYTEVYQHSRITLTVNDQLDSGTKLMLEERLDAYIPANCQINIHYTN